MKFRRTTALVLTLGLLAGIIAPVAADEIDDKMRQLEAIQRQIQNQRQLISKTKTQENNVIKEINRLEKEMTKTQNEINVLQNKVSSVQSSIDLTERDISEAEKNLNERTKYLGERLVRIHEAGEMSYLDVLLCSTDMTDFITRWDMLNEIISQDRNIIEAVTAERQELENKRSSLESAKRELISIKEEKGQKEQILKKTADTKEEVLQDIKKQRKLCEQALRELEENSKELEKIIQRLQSSTGEYRGTGKFCWPVPGHHNCNSDYGWRRHPILKEMRMHTGIDLSAPKGAAVVAVDNGRVLYAGSMGAYGKVVIIDHGGEISTLYAHLLSYNVKVGNNVVKGSTIARADSTGWSTGHHLHFEVRKNGVPINPRPYIY